MLQLLKSLKESIIFIALPKYAESVQWKYIRAEITSNR